MIMSFQRLIFDVDDLSCRGDIEREKAVERGTSCSVELNHYHVRIPVLRFVHEYSYRAVSYGKKIATPRGPVERMNRILAVTLCVTLRTYYTEPTPMRRGVAGVNKPPLFIPLKCSSCGTSDA